MGDRESAACPNKAHVTFRVMCFIQDTITLQWIRPADNGSPVTSYRLERDDGRGGADFQLVYAGVLLTATASGLRHGLRYGFRLLAENDVSAEPAALPAGWLQLGSCAWHWLPRCRLNDRL